MKQKTKARSIAFAACLTAAVMITLVSAAYLPVEEAAVYDNVVRLHVIANSDSGTDQELKYAVRDAILNEARDIFRGRDIAQAIDISQSSLSLMESIASNVLERSGAGYSARAVFGDEEYPAREYDGELYPAGKYHSLRVVLGEGKGKNWWCVLFPPLCLGSSQGTEIEGTTETTANGAVNSAVKSAGVAAESRPRCRIRLKILELFGFN